VGGPHAAKRSHPERSQQGSAELTPKRPADYSRRVAPTKLPERHGVGARPNLENSTACQKSMPITSSRGVEPKAVRPRRITSNENPLVDNE
jgi:hypothetical protein